MSSIREYQCSVCGKKVKDDLLVYIGHTETHIIDEIKKYHPEWVQDDGLCAKCVDYYKGQLKGRGGFCHD